MDFFRIKQSPVAAEFCHNIHDIRRFPEFHDRRIACKNRCFHIFKFILERIGCVTGLNDGLFCGHLAGRIHQQNGCLFIGQCFQLIQFTAVEGNGLFKSFCCSQNNIHDIVITKRCIQRQMVIGGSAPYLSCIIMIIICSAAFLLENQILGFFLC